MEAGSETKYPQAPLSEVIFGVTLEGGRFNDNNVLIDLVAAFRRKGFLDIELHQPLSNEKLEEFSFSKTFNPDVAGQVLYRCFDENRNHLIQIQNNKFLFNWIRNEGEDPANYPGFETVKSDFFCFLNLIEEEYGKYNNEKLSIEENIRYCELTYQDRVFWQEHVPELSDIDKIINHSLPTLFSNGESFSPNNEFANFTFDLTDKLNGHGLLSLNTSTSNKTGSQILNLQIPLRGSIEGFEDSEQWFDEAHQIQFQTFENLFTKETKERWQRK